MSYHTWHNYGFGICTTALENADTSRIRALIHCAPAYEQKVEALLQAQGISDADTEDYLALHINSSYGIASIMADVIEEAEDLILTACDDYDSSNFLLYMPSYPWAMRANECTLTEERVRHIIEKYAAILSDEIMEIGYESVENGG